MIETIHTSNAPAAIGPYSQAKKFNGFVFASGQIAINPATSGVEESTIEGQTIQVCENIKAILEAAHTNLDNVLKTTCFLSDISDFASFNEIYGRYFTEKPARSCVAVKDLPKSVKVEIEVIAVASEEYTY